jgi:hypothetical protein
MGHSEVLRLLASSFPNRFLRSQGSRTAAALLAADLLFETQAVVQDRTSLLLGPAWPHRTPSVASSIPPPIVTGRPPAISLRAMPWCALGLCLGSGAGLEDLTDEHGAATPSCVSRRPITRRWPLLSDHSPAITRLRIGVLFSSCAHSADRASAARRSARRFSSQARASSAAVVQVGLWSGKGGSGAAAFIVAIRR